MKISDTPFLKKEITPILPTLPIFMGKIGTSFFFFKNFKNINTAKAKSF